MAKIMVVDDAAFMRMTIKQYLEAEGHEVVGEAANGIEAVEKYPGINPDVVILDITMPDMNGIEALKRIKILDPKAKIVICSAMGQQEMVAQAIQHGARQFIVKPFQKENLVAAVEKILAM